METIIYIGGEIAIKNCPTHIAQQLKFQATLPNPKYYMWEAKASKNSWYKDNVLQPERNYVYWRESKGNLYLPRGMWDAVLSLLPNAKIVSLLVDPKPVSPFQFNGKSWYGQAEAVDSALQHNFGYVLGPTGSGKTSIGIQIACKLGLTTLFMVHTDALLQQAYERVEKFTGYTPGLIGGGNWNVKDFTIGTFQTIYKKDCSSIKNSFGLVIADEFHHMQAETFFAAVRKFNSLHAYGLTATDTGKMKYINLALGQKVAEVDRKGLVEAKTILEAEVYVIKTGYKTKKEYENYDLAKLYTELASSPKRNSFVLDLIKSIQPGRRTVIASHRIDQLDWFYEQLKEFNPVLYHGKLKTKQKKISFDRMQNDDDNRIVLTTVQIIQEGFDAPHWDQLVMATPIGGRDGVEQLIGRVVRKSEGKMTPRVFDLLDNSILTETWLNNRLNRYEKLNAKVHFDKTF